MRHAILDSAVRDYEAQFDLQALRGEISFVLPGEACVTVYVPGHPTAAMIALAHTLEQDYDALGRTVRVQVKSAE